MSVDATTYGRDRERLDTAIEGALAALDRLSWEGEAIRLRGMSKRIREPWRPGAVSAGGHRWQGPLRYGRGLPFLQAGQG